MLMKIRRFLGGSTEHPKVLFVNFPMQRTAVGFFFFFFYLGEIRHQLTAELSLGEHRKKSSSATVWCVEVIHLAACGNTQTPACREAKLLQH